MAGGRSGGEIALEIRQDAPKNLNEWGLPEGGGYEGTWKGTLTGARGMEGTCYVGAGWVDCKGGLVLEGWVLKVWMRRPRVRRGEVR